MYEECVYYVYDSELLKLTLNNFYDFYNCKKLALMNNLVFFRINIFIRLAPGNMKTLFGTLATPKRVATPSLIIASHNSKFRSLTNEYQFNDLVHTKKIIMIKWLSNMYCNLFI